MKKIFIYFIIYLSVVPLIKAQKIEVYKFSKRTNITNAEFLYLNHLNNPTKIGYRASQDKEILEVEITQSKDNENNIIVKFSKKKIWKIKLNPSFLIIIDEKNQSHTYSLEEDFAHQEEKIYVQYSLAGIGAFYYTPSLDAPPKELKIIKKQAENSIYEAIFPNNGGKAMISFDNDKNIIVKKENGTTKNFIRK